MKTSLFTKQIHDSLQRGYSDWRRLVSESVFPHDIDFIENSKNRFTGSIHVARFSEEAVMARLMCSNGQTVQPNSQRSRFRNKDSYLLCLQIDGSAVLSTRRETVTLETGNWTLCDFSEPYAWIFPAHHGQLVLRIPRQELSRKLRFPDAVSGRVFNNQSGSTKILWDFIHSIWQEMEASGDVIDRYYSRLIIEMLVRVVNEQLQTGCESANRRHNHLLAEAKTLIDDQIRNPDLHSKYVAGAMGISNRYLFYLFQNDNNTFSQYVRNQRLEKCRSDLTDPLLSHCSVSEIAFKWGFSNISHFSRLFKQAYGVSPKQCRQSHLP